MKLLPFIFVFVLVLTCAGAVSEQEQTITLLSVSQYENGTSVGGTATLTLQVRPGSGAVFIESYPATQIDTQVATQLANEFACEYSTVNCNAYDFFYTLNTGSSAVSGPSGGAATTLLTLAVLEEKPLLSGVAMTGAITSGGIITPVSGVLEKIQAAQNTQQRMVLIPYLDIRINTSNESNSSDLGLVREEDLESFTIPIHLVKTIPEAFALATGTLQPAPVRTVAIPESYSVTMQATAAKLCARSAELLHRIPEEQQNTSLYQTAFSYYTSSLNATSYPYSQASFCYSANIPLQQLLLENLSQTILAENLRRLNLSIAEYTATVQDYPITTFADLETYVIVTERLLEAKEYVDLINQTNISRKLLAQAMERYASAVAWSGFFGTDAPAIQLDQFALRQACYQELRSVETRLNYLRSIFSDSFLTSVSDQLDQAYTYQERQEYAHCLFKASKAKAHANLFFSTLGLQEESVEEIVFLKLTRSQEVIAQQSPVFAILGYSYSEYAAQLLDADSYSSLLFSEYALVFSDLSAYFPAQHRGVFALIQDHASAIKLLFVGMLVGFALGFVLFFRR